MKISIRGQRQTRLHIVVFCMLFGHAVTVISGTANVTGAAGLHGASTLAMTFTMVDPIDITMTIKPAAEDVGKRLPIYLVAFRNRDWYMRDQNQRWIRWYGNQDNLAPNDIRTMSAEESVRVLAGSTLPPGEFGVYVGYRAANGQLIYNPSPLSFMVFDQDQPRLTPFLHPTTMKSYLKFALQQGMDDRSGAYGGSGITFSAGGSSPAISSTNVQESGVDEADLMETKDDRLYSHGDCEPSGSAGPCLFIHQLSEQPAQAAQIGKIKLDADTRADGLYLLAGESPGDSDLIAVIGGGSDYWPGPIPMIVWDYPWQWRQATTDMAIYDVSDPAGIEKKALLQLDGALVSSRRIEDRVYLVTRYTPYLNDYNPRPVDSTQETTNQTLINDAKFADLVPQIHINGSAPQNLINPSKCHLPLAGPEVAPSASIISITQVPMKQPGQFTSTCILGSTETLYMSTESLYLATTQYNYVANGGPAAAPLSYSPDHSTEIHKFKLDEGGVEYRGAATILGHLGWERDKKSLRMGEYQGVLRVATSHGETWNNTSTTATAILRESDRSLEEIARIDGIGKPGERLYAARFIGPRGYLVTFRVTDPLYILDLADPFDPKVAGELEIDGYSDYLHPVGENLLLGIGKDAVPDVTSTDREFRGAWYQGLKISLFDVSNADIPREVDSLVLGKRGSESAALHDHHAFTYLPGRGNEPTRFALPVELYDTTPIWPGFDPKNPASFYDWTHTGLYIFEVTTDVNPGLQQAGSIIVEQAPDKKTFFIGDRDRSVLQGKAAHYLHAGAVYSNLINGR